MKISLFPNAYETVPEIVECEWLDLVELIGPHQTSTKAKNETPAFSPAEYPPGTRQKLKPYVTQLWLFVLDVDKASEEGATRTLELVERLGFAAVMYTSWSHAEKPWSFRLVMPLSRPVSSQEWPEFWAKANSAFEGVGDTKCKNQDRIYYLPYAPAGTEAVHLRAVFEGDTIDVGAVLELPYPPPSEDPQSELSPVRFKSYATRLAKSRDDYRAELGQMLTIVCKGEEFAQPGERDVTLYKLACVLGEKFVDSTPESIAKHFELSLGRMEQIAPFRSGFDATMRDLAGKIRRQQEKHFQKKEEEIDESRVRVREAFGNGRDYPYSAEELASFPATIDKRWILQRGNSYYLFFNGVYRGPYTDKEILSMAIVWLAPAPVQLFRINKEGETIQKSLGELMRTYGTVAEQVVLDLNAQKSRYEESTRTIVEAPCPLRKITPKEHPEIDQWLRKLGGDKYEVLKSWIAAATLLERACRALFLTGPPGIGKTLFALALARLWTEDQPTSLEDVFSSFNDALARCPLCFGDEKLPKDNRGQAKSAELRTHIQETTRSFRRKFHSNATLKGATRTIITANNNEVLATTENLTTNDVDAIVDRYLHIAATDEAAEYLKQTKVVDGVEVRISDGWVDRDEFAEHALWLRDNHEWTKQGRFLIEITDESLQRSLITRDYVKAVVLQWLVGYLLQPSLFDAAGKSNKFVRIKEGKLLVNVQGVLGHWDLYVDNERCPSTGKLASALAGICETEGKKDARMRYLDDKGKFQKYRVVKTEMLVQWAEENGFAEREEIMKALETDTENRIATLQKPERKEERTN